MDGYSQETLRRIDGNDDTLVELGISRNNHILSRDGRYFTSTDGGDYSKLGSYIGRNTQLETLFVELRDIRLSVSDSGFFEGIKLNSSINKFRLSGYNEQYGSFTPVGEVGCALLNALHENNSNITTLHIWSCNIGNVGVCMIINTTLGSCTNLKIISLTNNGITDELLLPMVEAIRGHSSLHELILWENRIDNAGCEALATLLQDPNCNIHTLNIHGNHIRNEGAIAIANSLVSNTKLKELNLRDNQIGNEGAIAIANSLANNTKLKELIISDNQMDNQNIVQDAFSRVLCNTSSINAIYSSNHTLANLFGGYEEEERMGDPLVSLLRLNEKTNKSHAAIKKILKYHPKIDMTQLFEWGTGDERNIMALPYVIDWFGRAKEAVEHVDENDRQSKMLRDYVRQREGYTTKERKLTAIYEFALAMPLLFIPNSHAKAEDKKRKRKNE